jgi:protein-tyrosine phosphatase
MARPRGGEDLEDEVTALAGLQVALVVSLLEPSEVRELELRAEQAQCEARGLSFISFPVPDRGVPQSAQAFIALAHMLRSRLRAGAGVAIHCRAGIGRSGLLAGSVLVAMGRSPNEALAITAAARGVKVPDTQEQEAWLHTHARLLQSAA